MICPRCLEPLMRYRFFAGLVWQCERCGGRAVALSVLRKAVQPQVVRGMWSSVVQGGVRSPLLCPSCRQAMQQVVAPSPSPVTLEVCSRCQFVWADAIELEQLPPASVSAPPKEPDLPPQAKEALALAKVEALRERARSQAYSSEEVPDDVFSAALALLGLPVEVDNPIRNYPWGTWLTAFTVVATSLLAFWQMERALDTLALVPAEWWRMGGINLLTNFFVHGSLLHLVGNLYFLVVFGDNVEDLVGHTRFLALLVASTLMGNVAHILFDPRSEVPCVGASGGVFGLIAFYVLLFPQVPFLVAYRFRFFVVPAWVLALMWLLFQMLGVWQQVSGAGQVSSLAHVGGALAGVGAWILWRKELQYN